VKQIRPKVVYVIKLDEKIKTPEGSSMYLKYWVIQNDCGQVWQLCTKIYVATVWVG
jgi:hypothetical protein